MFPASAGPISIRTVEIDGAPWFVVKDVCLALGVYVYYGKVNTADAMKKLPHTDKGSVGVDRIQPWPFDARAKAVSVVSEAGLYKLVMRSDSTEARKFQDWVTRDVLPAIRKDGGYIMGEEGKALSRDHLSAHWNGIPKARGWAAPNGAA
ncbi:BRO family protein [Azospirillum sp. TSO5]|uniref:BRO-N domain-containing protein n=1 Tax=Azospirillum sp. TSO5 TaxID=716760 RepID=UPI0018EEAABF|nr:BRO family protein [Azospirillum sp. TSO5]